VYGTQFPSHFSDEFDGHGSNFCDSMIAPLHPLLVVPGSRRGPPCQTLDSEYAAKAKRLEEEAAERQREAGAEGGRGNKKPGGTSSHKGSKESRLSLVAPDETMIPSHHPPDNLPHPGIRPHPSLLHLRRSSTRLFWGCLGCLSRSRSGDETIGPVGQRCCTPQPS
jgi:hypothetical protein